MAAADPIAIVSALEPELAALRAALATPTDLDIGAGSRAWRGLLDDHEVVLAEAGIGKVTMAAVAALLIREVRPRLVVFTGVAGGLDSALGQSIGLRRCRTALLHRATRADGGPVLRG